MDKLPKQTPVLPKDAINFVHIGHSFAEHDPLLDDQYSFVQTPALAQASDGKRTKCIFVGRRGSGKTAITRYLSSHMKRCVTVTPLIFGQTQLPGNFDDFKDTHQRPFRSLVLAFKLALLGEVFANWIQTKVVAEYELTGDLNRERSLVDDDDWKEELSSM